VSHYLSIAIHLKVHQTIIALSLTFVLLKFDTTTPVSFLATYISKLHIDIFQNPFVF